METEKRKGIHYETQSDCFADRYRTPAQRLCGSGNALLRRGRTILRRGGRAAKGFLISRGRTISTNTADKYIRALCAAYVFYKVDRYDIKGKTLLKTQSKYYAVDSGLRELLLAGAAADVGRVLENVVYPELLRRGGKVRIGKIGEKEVDFVSQTADGVTYYQVSATVLDETTRKRELSSLQGIADHHPKFLLTLDEFPRAANYDGIRQLNVVDWLLNERIAN